MLILKIQNSLELRLVGLLQEHIQDKLCLDSRSFEAAAPYVAARKPAATPPPPPVLSLSGQGAAPPRNLNPPTLDLFC